MQIDNKLISEALKLELKDSIICENMGLISIKDRGNMLAYLDEEKFIRDAEQNKNISAIFITAELDGKLSSSNIKRIICDEPRFYFFTLLNFIGRKNYKKFPSVIDATAKIHSRASVSEYNVTIGQNVVIEPNVTILPDVIIGDDCIIRAGAVIGSEGFEHKRTRGGILSVFHDGKVIIGNNVEIGANTCVDKGFSFRDTIIGDYTKIDNLVHIGHCVHAGKRCLIAANAMIACCNMNDDVWIGPSSSIANNIEIGEGAYITLGSVVTKNVKPNDWVTGNFAIPHLKFLANLKKLIKEE